jgi:hypothetical protein
MRSGKCAAAVRAVRVCRQEIHRLKVRAASSMCYKSKSVSKSAYRIKSINLQFESVCIKCASKIKCSI